MSGARSLGADAPAREPARQRFRGAAGRVARGLGGVATLVVVSCVVTVFSEALYWFSGGFQLPGRVVFYLIPTGAMVWAAGRFQAAGWTGWLLVGAVYGFVTEGVLTPIAYGSYPFDPLAASYTALAWHAPLAVLGLVWVHGALAAGRVAAVAGVTAGIGALWGLWALTLRLPEVVADGESAGPGQFAAAPSTGAFVGYTAAVTLVLAAGHAILGRWTSADGLVPGKAVRWVLVAGGAVFFGALVVPAAPWAPIVLPVLLGLCVWGLRRQPAAGGYRPTLLDVLARRVPGRALTALAALPAAAGLVYGIGDAADLDEPALNGVYLGIVVTLTGLGWVLFLAALVTRARRAG